MILYWNQWKWNIPSPQELLFFATNLVTLTSRVVIHNSHSPLDYPLTQRQGATMVCVEAVTCINNVVHMSAFYFH